MIILLIVKPKRSRAPSESLPAAGSDPIGNLGAAEPQSAVFERGPDIVAPSAVEKGG